MNGAASEFADDYLLGLLAVRKGLVSQAQLDEAVSIRLRSVPTPRLLDVVTDLGCISPDGVEQLVMRYRKLLLGAIALNGGWVTPSQLNDALGVQQRSESRPLLGRVLVEMGFVSKDNLRRIVDAQESALSEALLDAATKRGRKLVARYMRRRAQHQASIPTFHSGQNRLLPALAAGILVLLALGWMLSDAGKRPVTNLLSRADIDVSDDRDSQVAPLAESPAVAVPVETRSRSIGLRFLRERQPEPGPAPSEPVAVSVPTPFDPALVASGTGASDTPLPARDQGIVDPSAAASSPPPPTSSSGSASKPANEPKSSGIADARSVTPRPNAIAGAAASVRPARGLSPLGKSALEAWTTFKQPGGFITSLCADGDALWIGTEDKGLWRLDLKADPAANESWTQFTFKDTATDHVYGLAVDTAGRVWVGTVNKGVSVYNGREWRTYGVLDGCSGERVFSIAADPAPKRGNVWIGTDHGLVCWSPALPASPHEKVSKTLIPENDGSPNPPRDDIGALAKGTWHTYTQANGLPSQQIRAVAVAPFGRVWLGTECDGLAWADPPYEKWLSVRAVAEKSGDDGESPGCGSDAAPGLPSNFANALAVFRDDTTVVATNYGLGIRRRDQRTWTSWQGLSKQPFENYVRNLAGDSAGGLWMATRHKGLARLDLATMTLTSFLNKPTPSLSDNYVFSVAVTSSGNVWAGTYGGGLARLNTPLATASKSIPATSGADSPSLGSRLLPEPLGTPTLADLNAMLAALAKVPFVPPEIQPQVIRLDDDWLTKGDCLGRYGRYRGTWCAICSPSDYEWGAGPENVVIYARIGPNAENDMLRHWVHWLYTKNPNSLEMPPTYYSSRMARKLATPDFTRRQAEWDDHGEAYPMAKDGPGLFCTLRIPPGLFYLSLYNFNKDGHDGNNRFRDYGLSVRTQSLGQPVYDISGFNKQPELARARMTDFWNGMYKRFLVRGPSQITFQVSRNHSFNTILAGVFLDLVDEYPVPYFQNPTEWQRTCADREKEIKSLRANYYPGGPYLQRFRPSQTEIEAASRVFNELERMRLVNPTWWAREGRPFYVASLRWTLKRLKDSPSDSDKQRLSARATTCYYQLGQYGNWEAGQTLLGKTTTRQIEKGFKWDGMSESCEGMAMEMVMSATGQNRK